MAKIHLTALPEAALRGKFMTYIYDKYCFRKTKLWLASMLLSFTAVIIVLIVAKHLKFDYYHAWLYKANFRNPNVYLKVESVYFWQEIFRFYLYLPIAFALDVFLRKMIFARVNKPQ